MQNPKYNKLISTLQEIFMLDHAELDFGIYRIMNQKRKDIDHFLQKELVPQVKITLAENVSKEINALEAELEKLVKTLKENDIEPDTSPKVSKIKEQIA